MLLKIVIKSTKKINNSNFPNGPSQPKFQSLFHKISPLQVFIVGTLSGGWSYVHKGGKGSYILANVFKKSHLAPHFTKVNETGHFFDT